jgi:hypothetical protein
MSLWCTTFGIADDDHDVDLCDRWLRCDCCGNAFQVHDHACVGPDRHWVYDDTLPCTCGSGPIVYQESHQVPDPNVRRGFVEAGIVAPHIGPDGEDRDDSSETHLPYLRLSVCASSAPAEHDTVVLDKRQVTGLRDALSEFLDGCDEEVAG